MADPTTTFTVRDGKPVLNSPAPAAAPDARTQIQRLADWGFVEGARSLEEAAYWQTTQADLVPRVAAELDSPGPVDGPDMGAAEGNAVAVDGAPAVADVRAIYADSDSADAREFLAAWPTSFDHDVAVAQRVAGEMRRSMGETAWSELAAAFDAMSDRQQLEIMWSLGRQGSGTTPATSTNSNRNQRTMTQTTTPAADLDAAIAQADADYYRAYHNFDRPAMARADVKRQALYSQRFGDEPVTGHALRG